MLITLESIYVKAPCNEVELEVQDHVGEKKRKRGQEKEETKKGEILNKKVNIFTRGNVKITSINFVHAKKFCVCKNLLMWNFYLCQLAMDTQV
jgi:hypothetical protein